MKAVFILLVFIPLFALCQEEDYSASLYFEDAKGNKDTLTLIDLNQTASMDVEDLLTVPLDSFDVRFITFRGPHPNQRDPYWVCEQNQISLIFYNEEEDFSFYKESKTEAIVAPECDRKFVSGVFSYFYIPTTSEFPITITWDETQFQDSCRVNSFISEIPNPFLNSLDTSWCSEVLDFGLIYLKDSNSITLNHPSPVTFPRDSSTRVYLYSCLLSSTSFTGEINISTKDLKKLRLTIHPNPTQDKLYLDTQDQNWQYKIYNLQGQQMMQGGYTDFVDVLDLTSGIYFLQLQKENELFQAIKFVKE